MTNAELLSLRQELEFKIEALTCHAAPHFETSSSRAGTPLPALTE